MAAARGLEAVVAKVMAEVAWGEDVAAGGSAAALVLRSCCTRHRRG